MQNGKGDTPRPTNGARYRRNYDAIFRDTQRRKLVQLAAGCRHWSEFINDAIDANPATPTAELLKTAETVWREMHPAPS